MFYMAYNETSTMIGIIMKKHLAKVKEAAKRRAPEIITATASIAALATYVVYVVKTNDNTIKIQLDPDAYDAMWDGSLTSYQTEDDEYIYTITQK